MKGWIHTRAGRRHSTPGGRHIAHSLVKGQPDGLMVRRTNTQVSAHNHTLRAFDAD